MSIKPLTHSVFLEFWGLKPMKKNGQEFYRLKLLEKRKDISETIEQLRDLAEFGEEKSELIDKYSSHLADQGTDSIGREEAFLLISRELQYLRRIDNALKLMDRGQYGICKICSKKISHERLVAVPTTEICIKCKEKEKTKIMIHKYSGLK
jgi:RNA polymerase-binding protein DksA